MHWHSGFIRYAAAVALLVVTPALCTGPATANEGGGPPIENFVSPAPAGARSTPKRRPAIDRPIERKRPVSAEERRPRVTTPARQTSENRTRRIARRPETAPSGQPPQGETRFLDDEVIVRYRLSSSPRGRDALVRRLDLRHVEGRTFALAGITVHRYQIVSGATISDTIAALEADLNVVNAQPNYLYEAQQAAKPAGAAQYAIDRLGIREAQDMGRGSGVRLAIIDSAIDTSHEEFAGAAVDSFDVRDDPDGSADTHGTSVAGILAARSTLLGIAPEARILGIAAFSRAADGSVRGNSWTVARGLDIAHRESARIVNLSFAGPADPLVERSLAGIARRDVIAVAAMGNSGPRAAPLYPAAYASTIAVTAIDSTDRIYAEATGGAHVAVAAPGVDILTLAPGGAFGFASGTSLAAAHVSGIAALLLAADPSVDRTRLETILQDSAADLGAPGRDSVFGAGVPDASAALRALATQ